jgi:hypothetical protein
MALIETGMYVVGATSRRMSIITGDDTENAL